MGLGYGQFGSDGLLNLKAAVTAQRIALEVFTREAQPLDWARGKSDLGFALDSLGQRQLGEEGIGTLKTAVAAYRAALEVFTRGNLPVSWATTQSGLGKAC